MKTLYLIPTTLGDCDLATVLPPMNNEITRSVRHFIVEDVRTARRFLRKIDPQFPIDDCHFFTLNEHTSPDEIAQFLAPIADGHDIGVISEAGCPAVADPGADVVAIAQCKGICVKPLVGASSILLALMASGFNGQNFAFVGYLPIENQERTRTLKKLESRAYAEKQTQLFIETPYRNSKLLEEILKTCQAGTRLCIAADITLPAEFIRTKTIAEWRKQTPDIGKRPCIFAIYF